jgi:hypothetical protein
MGLVLNGARREIRTPDLRITNAPLYQLSYSGNLKPGGSIEELELMLKTTMACFQILYLFHYLND